MTEQTTAPTMKAAVATAEAAVKADVSGVAAKVKAAAIKYGIPAAALAVGFLLGKHA